MDEVSQAFSSLKSAIQLIKALHGVYDTAVIDSKMIELRDHIIDVQGGLMEAQAKQSSLIHEVDRLKQQLMKLDSWEKEKQRYQLINPWSGFHVFALQGSAKPTDPPHWICPSCYEKGRKEYLQFTEVHKPVRRAVVQCHGCSLQIERKNWDEMQYAERYAEKTESKVQAQSGPV